MRSNKVADIIIGALSFVGLWGVAGALMLYVENPTITVFAFAAVFIAWCWAINVKGW